MAVGKAEDSDGGSGKKQAEKGESLFLLEGQRKEKSKRTDMAMPIKRAEKDKKGQG